jgi:hypothetical protein
MFTLNGTEHRVSKTTAIPYMAVKRKFLIPGRD